MDENISAEGTSQEAKGQIEEGSNGQKFGMTEEQHETLKKALSQRAKFKEELEVKNSELEKYRQQSLEAEGKKDEALNYWKQKATEFETKYKESTQKYGWNQVKSQLTSELNRAGCVEPDVALSLIDKNELKSVEVDDNYNVSKMDLERIVDTLRRDQRAQRLKLFSAPGVNDMTPASGARYEEPKEDITKMSTDEILKKLKE